LPALTRYQRSRDWRSADTASCQKAGRAVYIYVWGRVPELPAEGTRRSLDLREFPWRRGMVSRRVVRSVLMKD